MKLIPKRESGYYWVIRDKYVDAWSIAEWSQGSVYGFWSEMDNEEHLDDEDFYKIGERVSRL